MKKSLLFVTIFTLTLTTIIGCNKIKEEPTKVVQVMFDKIIEGNYEDINKPLEDMYKSSNISKVPDEIYYNIYKSINYEILEENIDKDTATVTVKINSISYNDVFTMASLQVYDTNYNEDGTRVTPETESSTNLVIQSLVEFSKSAPISEKTATINLKLVDSEWIPTIDKELWNEVVGVTSKG